MPFCSPIDVPEDAGHAWHFLFEDMRDSQQVRFLPVLRDQLNAQRQAVGKLCQRQRNHRLAGDIEGESKHAVRPECVASVQISHGHIIIPDGPPRELNLPGADAFSGTLIHSSDYHSGKDFSGKFCVVVGSASSAHDVCVDLWEAGADVSMLQRSPSIVVRSETLMELGFDIYSEDAVVRRLDVEAADMLAAARPFALFADQQRELYKTIRSRDAQFYDRFAAAGFAFDFGEDDSGLMMKALRTASGYYIDVAASELITDGEIEVISSADVVALSTDGLRLSSGQEVAAEVVIACTGYQSMNESVAGIVSREAADAIGPWWGLGSGVTGDPGPWQRELRTMWKPTIVEALWFHGGNLALSRFYSRFVALQLKARMEGLSTPVYAAPEPVQSGL